MKIICSSSELILVSILIKMYVCINKLFLKILLLKCKSILYSVILYTYYLLNYCVVWIMLSYLDNILCTKRDLYKI